MGLTIYSSITHHLTYLNPHSYPKTKLVTELAPNNTLFSDNDGTNPYAPEDDSQFYLPLDILPSATDKYGQILGDRLDDLFVYTSYGGVNGIVNDNGSFVFSDELRALFIEAFVYNTIQKQIDLYQECVDDTSTQLNFTGNAPDGLLGNCEGGKSIFV